MADRPIVCPRCGSRGPFSAVRLRVQVADLSDADGDPLPDHQVGWEDTGETVPGKTTLRCDECGHGWRTRRSLPEGEVLGDRR